MYNRAGEVLLPKVRRNVTTHWGSAGYVEAEKLTLIRSTP